MSRGSFFVLFQILRAFARVWDCDRVFVRPDGSWGRVFSIFVDYGLSRPMSIWHSMESLILAQDERWRRA